MDIKVPGITFEIMEKALAQAHEGRMFILERMSQTIGESRPELSRYAPRMYRIQVPQDKIGTVIGPGGRMIRSIIEETKATINIEDDGTVFIGSANEEMAKRAIQIIQGLTKDIEVGEIYTGQVTRLASFGAFVEILPGKEGLVRLPDLADYPVSRPEDVVRIGDEIMVMVIEVDNLGRINLSRRAVLEGATVPPAPSQSGSPPRRDGPPGQRQGAPQMQGGRRPQRNNGRPGPRQQDRGDASGRERSRDFRRRPEGEDFRRRQEGEGASSPPPPPPPRPPFGGRR
jgi:polyribonucleotide nucleotidyltransferase